MADAPPDGTPAAAKVAANAIGSVVHNAPHRGVVAAQRAKAGRSETAALIIAGRMGDAKPSVAPASPAAPPRESPTEEKPDATTPEAETAPATQPEAAPDVSPVGDRPDPETAKRLGTIAAAEKRHREKIAADRAEIETRLKGIEREWTPRVKAAEDFEDLKAKAAKARSNPALIVDVFRALGWTDDHLEPAAQAMYALSKAGAADPTRKAHAEKLLREREAVDTTSALQKRIDDLEARLTGEKQQSEFEQLQGQFLDGTLKEIDAPAVKAGAPTVAAMAAKNSPKLRAALWRHTVELTRENDGDVPEFSAVVARYQAELDEMGVPRPAAQNAAPATDTKKNNQTADKQTTAKTLSADLSTPRVPRDAQSGKDHRAETRRLIAAGKLE